MAENDKLTNLSRAVEGEVENDKKKEKTDDKPAIEIRFGARIHTLRLERRLPQDVLASRAQVHRNYISEMERGKRNVSLRIIEKLAKALGVEIAELFRSDDFK